MAELGPKAALVEVFEQAVIRRENVRSRRTSVQHAAIEQVEAARSDLFATLSPQEAAPGAAGARNTVSEAQVEAIRNAVLNCGHTIVADEIILRRSDRETGNALNQLQQRIRSALTLLPSGQNETGGEVAKLDGNEIWEWLFGELRGDVPEELTDALLARLAAHINCVFLALPASGERNAVVEAADGTVVLPREVAQALFYYGCIHPVTNVSASNLTHKEALDRLAEAMAPQAKETPNA